MIILRSIKKGSFFVGADIKYFLKKISSLLNSLNKETAFHLSSNYQNFIKKILTTIAFIEGDCLGGGLELALACNHCFAFVNSKARFGFPEVQLGLIPGGLGTYLALTRCLPEPIFKMILSGKTVGVEEAADLGIINRFLYLINRHLRANLCAIIKGGFRLKTLTQKKMYPFMCSRITEHSSGYNPAPFELLSLRQKFYWTYCPDKEIDVDYCQSEAKTFSNLLDSHASFSYRNLHSVTVFILF
ncbi:hypothetical protein MXB_669 [Myxobolus squamalis]|nr:hypothetical protein MXB_669 [Myxobolus squamalis]